MSDVVFDLGGVLIDWDPRHLYRRILPDEDAVERFLAEICTPEWNLRQDAGRPFDVGVRELVERHPDEADLIRAYRDRWTEMIAGSIGESVALLDEVRRTHRVFALTNWSAETFPIARERFEFLSWFEGTVVSGEEGVNKPDTRIFEILLGRHALVAADTVFIDDNEANVAAAAGLGIDAIHFVGPGALRAALDGRGLVSGSG